MDLTQLHICVQQFHADDHIDSMIKQMHLNEPRLRAIFMNEALWPLNTTITISFMLTDNLPQWYDISMIESAAEKNNETVDPLEYTVRNMSLTDAIKTVVMQRVAPQVPGLTLSFIDGGGMVRVRLYSGGGSSSLIGTQCKTANPQDYTLTFGWMDVATIIHEFSHALGMLHEHQNPEGGIQWNVPMVYKWAEQTQGWDRDTTYRNIIATYSMNQITGSVFDPKSVMLYFFPADLTINHVGTRQNIRYSNTDIAWLNAMYPIGGVRKVIPKTLMPDTQDTTSKSKWSVMEIGLIIVLIVIALCLLIDYVLTSKKK